MNWTCIPDSVTATRSFEVPRPSPEQDRHLELVLRVFGEEKFDEVALAVTEKELVPPNLVSHADSLTRAAS